MDLEHHEFCRMNLILHKITYVFITVAHGNDNDEIVNVIVKKFGYVISLVTVFSTLSSGRTTDAIVS